MNTEEIARIVGDQRAYFKTHATFDVDARRRALVSLRDAVRAHEADIAHALKTDLGKSHDAFRDSTSDRSRGSVESSAPASVRSR